MREAFLRLRARHPSPVRCTWADVLVDTIERADLDGDVMANPPLWAELFFRPELEDDGVDVPDTDGGPRDTVDGSRNSLDDVAEPSVGATVTITDALPPLFLRGIKGILSSSSPAMMEPCAGARARGYHRRVIADTGVRAAGQSGGTRRSR